MWPFARRRSRVIDEIDTRIPTRLAGIDFSRNDAVIKLWLSEPLLDAIDLLCDTYDASRPDILRWLLFEHAYGRIEFAHLLRQAGCRPRIVEARTSTSSSAPSNTSIYGKASEDVKLHLPATLQQTLLQLAERRHLSLSEYVRCELRHTLLGESEVRYSPARMRAVQHAA
jgi:hypothetical protein